MVRSSLVPFVAFVLSTIIMMIKMMIPMTKKESAKLKVANGLTKLLGADGPPPK